MPTKRREKRGEIWHEKIMIKHHNGNAPNPFVKDFFLSQSRHSVTQFTTHNNNWAFAPYIYFWCIIKDRCE